MSTNSDLGGILKSQILKYPLSPLEVVDTFYEFVSAELSTNDTIEVLECGLGCTKEADIFIAKRIDDCKHLCDFSHKQAVSS